MPSLEKRRYLCVMHKALNGYLSKHLTPSLKFYPQADLYKFKNVDVHSLKLNFARIVEM